MEDAAKENPPADTKPASSSGGTESLFNKIDLTQLQGFSFGTQWTQEKPQSGPERRPRADRPHREDRDDGPGRSGAPVRKDRRGFQRPSGPGTGAPERQGGQEAAAGQRPGDGPRYQGRPRGDYDPRRRGPAREPAPYVSPDFNVSFYPEETSFGALIRTIRATCRTFELFDIARSVLGKPERFTVVVARKSPEAPGAESADQAGPGREGPSSRGSAAVPPVAISVPDGLPFESEESAVAHVLKQHLGLFFEQTEVTVDPPKGNYPVINRCAITGELLGPPNYHRYSQIVQKHHAERISRLSLEEYRATRIESVRDPEVVQQWMDKMKKATRYTWKVAAGPAPVAQPPVVQEPVPQAPVSQEPTAPLPAPGAPEAAPPAEAGTGAPPEQPHQTEEQSAQAAPIEAAPEAPPKPAAPSFESLEEAKAHLLAHARDKVVRLATHARFPGRIIEQLPQGEIRRAVAGALERQRRFPLDTANLLRGRLRREHFTIFKKGAKGVSYVCAVKRKFRVPGQVFAESIGSLIAFLEAHPMVKAADLADQLLGLGHPAPDAVLSQEQREKIARLQADLHWLVHEGYVTEFIDGGLYAPPAMVEARKREVEAEELDPENFPEAPRQESAEQPVAAPASSAAEAPAAEPAEAPGSAEPAEPSSPTAPPPPAAIEAPAEPPSAAAVEAPVPPAPAAEGEPPAAPAQDQAVETPAAPTDPAPEGSGVPQPPA